MGNFFIAIGGTGQMAALAYLRLSKLAGFEPAEIYLMDCDNSGPITQKLKDVLGKDTIPTIRPLPNDQNIENFRSAFQNQEDSNLNDLLSVVFTKQQLDTHVASGMYAKPPVGSSMLMEKIRRVREGSETDDDLQTLINSITGRAGSRNRVVINGSVMGGTGAGGVPTLAKYISNHVKGNAELTIVDFLKWFHIPTHPNTDAELERNAQSGIYYLQDKLANDVDACVLLGLDQAQDLEYQGVGEQEECRHFINLVAGVIINNAFQASNYQTLFPTPNAVYAYVMPENGFGPEQDRDMIITLPNGKDVMLTRIIMMKRAVSVFMGKLADYLDGGPSFFSFTPSLAVPKQLGQSLDQLAEVNSKSKKELWNDVAAALKSRKQQIDEWLGWFDTLFLRNYCMYPVDKTTISGDEYDEAKEAATPMDFLRYWDGEMMLRNWQEKVKEKNIEGFIDELVLSLKRAINKKYLNKYFGEDQDMMQWLHS